MRAEKNIESGLEIFHSYGKLGNSQLLHTYGFVLEENSDDFILVPLQLLIDNYVKLRKRRDKLGVNRDEDYQEFIEIFDSSDESSTTGNTKEELLNRRKVYVFTKKKYFINFIDDIFYILEKFKIISCKKKKKKKLL